MNGAAELKPTPWSALSPALARCVVEARAERVSSCEGENRRRVLVITILLGPQAVGNCTAAGQVVGSIASQAPLPDGPRLVQPDATCGSDPCSISAWRQMVSRQQEVAHPSRSVMKP